MGNPRSLLRIVGLLLALSTPISAFVSYALVAVTVGEERLETADGLTGLGYASLAFPLFLGLAIATWAHFNMPIPSSTTIAASVLFAGVACLIAAGISISNAEPNDADIGGALIGMFGIGLIILAIVLGVIIVMESRRPAPPPPPTPPSH